MFKSRVVFHASWKGVNRSISSIWPIYDILLSLRKDEKSSGSLWRFPQPIQGSRPIHTLIHDWIFQVRPSLMMLRDFRTAFHIMETPRCILGGWKIQSIRGIGPMYFEQSTLVHKLFDESNCHPRFSAKAEEKSSSLFMTHPPHFLGREMASHFTHAKILPDCFPF